MFADYLDERTTNRHRPDPVSGFAAHLRARRRVDGVLALAALYRSLANETEAEAAELNQLHALEDAIETRGPELGAATEVDELLPKVIVQESSWAKKLAERIQVRSVDAMRSRASSRSIRVVSRDGLLSNLPINRGRSRSMAP